jgi:hypothetical protein
MKHTWKTRGVYVWTTRRPLWPFSIPFGLLLLLVTACSGAMLLNEYGWWSLLPVLLFELNGRHIAYVGQTNNRSRRDVEHIFGSVKYGTKPKPWSDLQPRAFSLPSFHWWKWSRELSEKLWIWLLLPVYNVQWNTLNPRRITPHRAEQHRKVRDGARRARKIWVR